MRYNGSPTAKVMVIMDAPSKKDVIAGFPCSSYLGTELTKALLEVGFVRSNVVVTSVLREEAPYDEPRSVRANAKREISLLHRDYKGHMMLPMFFTGLEYLKREIEEIRPQLIVAAGDLAALAVAGVWGAAKWRGSVLPCIIPSTLEVNPKVVITHKLPVLHTFPDWRPIIVRDLKRAYQEWVGENWKIYRVKEQKYIIKPSFATVMQVLTILQQQLDATKERLALAIDIETARGHIDCIGLAWSDTEAMCIPFASYGRPAGYFSFDEEFTILMLLRQVMNHPMLETRGQNYHYDAQWIYDRMKALPRCIQDTMIYHHCLFPNMEKSLGFMASMYQDNYVYWKDEGKIGEVANWEQRWIYNCKDACATWEILPKLRKAAEEMKRMPVVEFQHKLWYPVLWTMMRGVRVDHQYKSRIMQDLLTATDICHARMVDLVGYEVNTASPAQVKAMLYDDFRFPVIRDRKTHQPTSNDEAIRACNAHEPLFEPVGKLILQERSLRVFNSTFASAATSKDGRMRTSFKMCGTDTFRFASSENAFGSGLNFQNIPSGDPSIGLPNMRQMFIPDVGYEFFDIDLNAADLRTVVWESDEKEMKDMLARGLDPYTEVAKEFYKDPSITKKDPRRQLFKAFCHGTNYLGTAKGLAGRVGLTIIDAERTQKWYFERFPRIKKWQDRLKDQVLKRKFVSNAFGYTFYFFGRIEGTVLNQAAAWIPQSTVGCIINRAYVNIYENLPEVEVLLQVHDSLAGQYPKAQAERYRELILQNAQIVVPYDDPMIIPVGINYSSESWGGCK